MKIFALPLGAKGHSATHLLPCMELSQSTRQQDAEEPVAAMFDAVKGFKLYLWMSAMPSDYISVIGIVVRVTEKQLRGLRANFLF